MKGGHHQEEDDVIEEVDEVTSSRDGLFIQSTTDNY
jgi:hypothetical protein